MKTFRKFTILIFCLGLLCCTATSCLVQPPGRDNGRHRSHHPSPERPHGHGHGHGR